MVFVGLSYRGLFNPVLLEETILFGFLWIFFLFKLFRRSVFLNLVPDFFLLSARNICLGSFLRVFLYFLSVYSTIVIEIAYFTEQRLHGSVSFYLFFTFFLSWILYDGTFSGTHYFFWGFVVLFLLRGFWLVSLFDRWQHSNFSSTRTFFLREYLWFSSPHMLQPNCRGNDWSDSNS